jgi:histidinol-phosphate phosphatase family protein
MRRPEQFELLPGVAEGIKLLNELNLKVIVVTNQSGIARGYFTEGDLQKIHERMIDELERNGARIDAIHYCPHHPDENCNCRKPKILMLERAAREFGLDLKKCFIVGDRKLDVDTGTNAGCTSVLVPSPETEPNTEADYVATDFLDAAEWIIERVRETSGK